jgi:hypothetical protein
MAFALRTILAAAIAGSQLFTAPVAMACPPEYSGVVSGGNTIDYEYFSGDFSAGTYALGVKATGTGNNTFTIKVETRGTFGWSTLTSASIDMGSAANNCGYRQLQFTLTSPTEIRFRFSRTVGSTQVNYSWDTDFLVVWGGSSFRCLNC